MALVDSIVECDSSERNILYTYHTLILSKFHFISNDNSTRFYITVQPIIGTKFTVCNLNDRMKQSTDLLRLKQNNFNQ